MPEFTAWPKTPRLSKSLMVITEKIDGTNAAIGFSEDGEIYCQSRSRIITPGKSTDNYGFAGWAYERAGDLFKVLGPGLHFGEWWGGGIQRGYGLAKDDKRFSLFNTARFNWVGDGADAVRYADVLIPKGLAVVPVLALSTFDTEVIKCKLDALYYHGSHAVPGYMEPEGICVWVREADRVFKLTYDGDDHKYLAA